MRPAKSLDAKRSYPETPSAALTADITWLEHQEIGSQDDGGSRHKEEKERRGGD